MAAEPPPPAVLRAFAASGKPVALGGGRGTSWRVGDTVFKPLDAGPSERELEWQAHVLPRVTVDGFRIAPPVQAQDGSFVVAGWSAWEAVEGRHGERRWPEIVAAGERFHAALAGVPPPDFITHRADPWAIGDRIAWGELPRSGFAHVEHLTRLVSALEPIDAPSQLIHGDLTGNVLFDDRLPPAIIDFSPYWRPAAYASAIVVADALIREGAQEDVAAAGAHIEGFGQYLLRALIFRAVSDRLLRRDETDCLEDSAPYLQAADLAIRLAA